MVALKGVIYYIKALTSIRILSNIKGILLRDQLESWKRYKASQGHASHPYSNITGRIKAKTIL